MDQTGEIQITYVDVIATRLGWIVLAGHEERLQYLTLGHKSEQAALAAAGRKLSGNRLREAWCPLLAERLAAYAVGEPVDFSDVDIDEDHLTAFQRRVVRQCRRIARGQTVTYGQLAARVGAPGAARAVGNVMAANRYPLIVPCHRVIASGGALGGFSAPQGIGLKRRLLNLEAEPAATLSG